MHRRVAGFALSCFALVGAAFAESPSQYRPSPGSQPPVPVIRKAPEQTACDSYNEMLTMARVGREAPNAPAFTGAIAPISRAYFGGPKCKAWVSSEGGNTVNCTAQGKDEAWAAQTLAQHVTAAKACLPAWRAQVGARYARFTIADGTMDLTISRPDPLYGPVVETSAHFQPCEPLNEMLGLARHGRVRTDEPTYTSVPTRIAMEYYGAEACSARALPKKDSFAVSCIFAEADPATTRQFADLITNTVAACRPKWTRKALTDAVTFDSGNGATFLVEARAERPLGLMMTFEPKAK
jgi:hypothetical protein